MYINNIILSNFRNYDKLQLELSRGLNIIYGNNAQGKTNLLESIYVLAMTKSHRSFIDNSLIKENEKNASIIGILVKDNIKSKFEVNITKTTKKLKVDNNELKKVSDYISKMNIIIFYPEDLDIIKGSPSIRRRYLNLELSQLYNKYVIILNDYNRLLKMRNDYIKNNSYTDIWDNNYFNILTDYLIEKAILIYKMRKKFVNKLSDIASKIFLSLSGIENFNIKYNNFVGENVENIKEFLLNEFQEKFNSEMRYKTTLIGPHRDDLEFYIGNFNIKNYGSQGQQRMAVLALKLAEIEIFKNYTGYNPILLLDDVFSELDDTKKNNLLQYINSDIQTIITTTDLNNINKDIKNKSKLIKVDDGRIVEVKEVE